MLNLGDSGTFGDKKTMATIPNANFVKMGGTKANSTKVQNLVPGAVQTLPAGYKGASTHTANGVKRMTKK